jgi:glycosyltransferase involved in cell wall biosynthesis
MARIARFVDLLLCACAYCLIRISAPLVRLRTRIQPWRSVLFSGQAYYNSWYLSRALRERGWRADVLNWDLDDASQIYYHGEDYRFAEETPRYRQLWFYLLALWRYDVFHFSNARSISFGSGIKGCFETFSGPAAEIYLLKKIGKKIVYSNNGCLDGVSQSSFRRWGPEPVCDICPWRDVPAVCSDERNLEWGRFRNSVVDYQCLLGGNRVDFNDDPSVHEVPEFYCLDPEVWRPDLEVPPAFRLSFPPGTVRLYHAVGNFDSRTDATGVNIKSTHVYQSLVCKLKSERLPVEMMFFSKVPNRDLRFYQVQADIFLDMLTYGFFGATAREAMMLGKPVICFLRPEWLESMRHEIPEYVDELPVLSATPKTVETALRELVADPRKRAEIGARGRRFALKWHSSTAASRRFDEIYSGLLGLR